jgi:hypothetical protein
LIPGEKNCKIDAMNNLRKAIVVGAVLVATCVNAETTEPAKVTVDAKKTADKIIKVDEHTYRVGKITIDKESRTVTFPAKVFTRKGLIEYLIVNQEGKGYESILDSPVEPMDLQLALLLLDFNYGQNIKTRNDPNAPKGDALKITLEWKDGDKVKTMAAEDVVFDRLNKKPMAPGDWVFTGSLVVDGIFLAQQDKSLIATYHDPGALINYAIPTTPDKTGYSAYDANPDVLPAEKTDVTVTIKKK